jgi:hypothetical protein
METVAGHLLDIMGHPKLVINLGRGDRLNPVHWLNAAQGGLKGVNVGGGMARLNMRPSLAHDPYSLLNLAHANP